MDNPIPPAARGWIYVAGTTAAALATVAASVLAVLGLDAWQPVVTAASAAVATVVSVLARANLSLEEDAL